jgi:hypothetical protein
MKWSMDHVLTWCFMTEFVNSLLLTAKNYSYFYREYIAMMSSPNGG